MSQSDLRAVPTRVDALLAELRNTDASGIGAVVERMDLAFPDLWTADRIRLVEALAERPEVEAAAAWAHLCLTHAPTGRLRQLGLAGFIESPRHARLVLEVLRELGDLEEHWGEVMPAWRAYADHGLLGDASLPTAELCDALTRLITDARGRADRPRWRWTPEHGAARAVGVAILDTLTHARAADVGDALHGALAAPDPVWRLRAALTLWSHGFEVPRTVWRGLTADLETRAWAWHACSVAGQTDLLDGTGCDATALAASAVAAVVAAPELLGAVPDAVDLEGFTPAPDGDDAAGWALFRFRAPTDHPAAADGWLLAATGPGPDPRASAPYVPACVATRCEPWPTAPGGDPLATLQSARYAFPAPPGT